MEETLKGAKTIGEFLRRHYEGSLGEFWAKLPEGDTFRRQFLRYWEPWPDWALRSACEVWSVFFPKVRKELIYDSIRALHWFVFHMPLDGTPPEERVAFPELDSRVLGTLMGHCLAMPAHLRAKLDDALKSGRLSKQEHADFVSKHAEQLSGEGLLREMQPHLNHYFTPRPTILAEFSEALAEAKRKTFDEQGNLKETTLTDVYSKILKDWPEIEEMSGPTELCKFLSPVLLGSENDPDKKLDRVKKICRRLGIEFRSVVKGQHV